MAVLRTPPCLNAVDSVIIASESNIKLYFFIIVDKKDIVCNEKRSYIDTIFMDALEWLENSRVRMINFLTCSASRVHNRTSLVNSDVYLATENIYFRYRITLTLKLVFEVFEEKEEIVIQPLIWPLINMHKVSLKNKAQISCASFSFIAITRSFQSLRIMKLFDKSVFGTLWTKKPRILRNYSLTSIIENQIPELRDKK